MSSDPTLFLTGDQSSTERSRVQILRFDRTQDFPALVGRVTAHVWDHCNVKISGVLSYNPTRPCWRLDIGEDAARLVPTLLRQLFDLDDLTDAIAAALLRQDGEARAIVELLDREVERVRRLGDRAEMAPPLS